MISRLKAQYLGNVFVPKQKCDLPDGTEVELTIAAEIAPSSPITDQQRERVLARLVERMRNNPIPAGAPARFTRDELHDRI